MSIDLAETAARSVAARLLANERAYWAERHNPARAYTMMGDAAGAAAFLTADYLTRDDEGTARTYARAHKLLLERADRVIRAMNRR